MTTSPTATELPPPISTTNLAASLLNDKASSQDMVAPTPAVSSLPDQKISSSLVSETTSNSRNIWLYAGLWLLGYWIYSRTKEEKN